VPGWQVQASPQILVCNVQYQVDFERLFDSFWGGVGLATERQKMTLFFSFCYLNNAKLKHAVTARY
jgi:hypothetical protein